MATTPLDVPPQKPFQFGLKSILLAMVVVAMLAATFQFGVSIGISLTCLAATIGVMIVGVRRAWTNRDSTIGWGDSLRYSVYWLAALFPIWILWAVGVIVSGDRGPVGMVFFFASPTSLPNLAVVVAGSSHGSLKVAFIMTIASWIVLYALIMLLMW